MLIPNNNFKLCGHMTSDYSIGKCSDGGMHIKLAKISCKI